MANNEDSAQKNRIERLEISDSILTNDIQELTQESHELINKLDIKTDHEFAVTGEFVFDFDKPFNEDEDVRVFFGSMSISAPLSDFRKINGISRFISIGYNPLRFKIIGQKLLVSCKIYDTSDNFIVEIIDNKWRVNKNAVSKFNFDNKGFEVFDNKGRVSISVTIIEDNVLLVQGIFPNRKYKSMAIASAFGYSPNESFGSSEDEYRLDTTTFYQLFNYTGNKWHGERIFYRGLIKIK